MDQDSSVGIATVYGPDGPGFESRWEGRFSVHVQSVPGARTMDTGSFSWVKWLGPAVDRQTASSADVEERIELHGMLYGEINLYLYVLRILCVTLRQITGV